MALHAAECLERRLLLSTDLSFSPFPFGYAEDGFNPNQPAVADFNRDGIPDLAVVSMIGPASGDQQLKILLGNGDGNFRLGSNNVIGHDGRDLAVGDFNNDGRPDVAAVDSAHGSLVTFLGNGNGTLQPQRFVQAHFSTARFDLATGDFDGDGRLDLVAANQSALTEVFVGLGDGDFRYDPTIGSEGANGTQLVREQTTVAVADVNGDGEPDLITGDSRFPNYAVRVSLNKGNGTFFASIASPTGLGPDDIAVADFNEDGKPDLAVAAAAPEGEAVLVKLGNGDGTFGPDVALSLPTRARSVAVADFNGDFNLDVVVGSIVFGSGLGRAVRFFRGNGLGGFGPVQSMFVGESDADSVVVADLNRDGRPDVGTALNSTEKIVTLINIGDFDSGAVRGRVWDDRDNDGVFDANESGLAGRTVFVDADNDGALDAAEDRTTTRADGRYELSTPAGSRRLRQVSPPAWIGTAPADTPGGPTGFYNVNVVARQATEGWNFGSYFQGWVSGRVFRDTDADGVFDATEIGLAGRTAYIDVDDDGVRDNGEATALTGADGAYRFNLPPGTYRVRQVLPAGSFQTTPANPAGKTGAHVVTITATQAAAGRNFGAVEPGTISGRVFYDREADGISNDADPGQGGFRVYIDADDDAVRDAGERFADTNAQGGYSFANLYPATYTVRAVKPAGWEQTAPAPLAGGGDRAFVTQVFGGFDAINTDFGVIRPNFVSGRVYDDRNVDGDQDAGDPGLNQFRVFVDVSGNGIPEFSEPQVLSDPSGDYRLRVPVDGNFTVNLIRPSGWQSVNPAGPSQAVALFNSANVTGKHFGLTSGAVNNAGFRPPVNLASGSNPVSVATGHFNLDNRPDFAVANNASNDVTIFLGNGAGGFTPSPGPFAGSAPRQLTVLDVNADNRIDLVVAHRDPDDFADPKYLSVMLGNGNGTFQAVQQYATGFDGAWSVAAGDFNGDGRPDLAVGGKNTDQVAVLIGRPASTTSNLYSPAVLYAAGLGTVSIATADFNGDGRADLATANESADDFAGNATVLLGNGNGTFQAPRPVAGGGINQPSSVAAGDFNRDGRADLAVANPFADTVRVLFGNGDGSFNAATARTYGAGAGPAHVAVVDVDADGRADLVVACQSDGTTGISGGVSVLRNRGDGTFDTAVTGTTHTSPVSVASADFNLDSLPDLVAANFFSDDVSILINNRPLPLGPRVTAVYVDGTAWTAAFRQHLQDSGLGSSTLGFRVGGGAAQLDELPWSNVNRIHVVFSQDVNVDAADLAVRGVNQAAYALNAAAFAYAATTFTASWRLSANAANDRLLLDLNGDAGGVTDKAAAANRLDGEWADGVTAFPSGDGAAGGDFRLRLNLLPGDVNRSGGVVNSIDLQQARGRQFLSPSSPGTPPTGYTAFHDVDGSAFINAIDLQQVRVRQFSTLPAGNPSLAAAAPARPAAAQFAATRIRRAWAEDERKSADPLV